MGSSDYLNSTQNLVHPEWETLDPVPDIHLLFPRFDRKFFQGKLACVQLEWSRRMYSCAGVCYQRTNRMGKSCIIRLSEPLLKLRSRKDLVETLLHEMIHAYLFVLGIREGNGGHGTNFKRIMNGINRIAGTNITVYHTFHDEVSLYKTHWWKCNGPCRQRGPHYGTVKRSSNRKPGPYDFWWSEHQQSCGGEFIKVKEPSPKRKKAVDNKENTPRAKVAKKNPLENYWKKPTSTPGRTPKGSGTMTNPGGRTIVVRPTPKTTKVPTKTSTPVRDFGGGSSKKPDRAVPPGGNLKNVKQFKDLDSSSETESSSKKPVVPLFTGSGHSLGGGSSAGPRNSRLLAQFSPKEKKPRVEKKHVPTPETVDLTEDLDIFEAIDLDKIKQERQDAIKKEIIESLTDEDMDDIILIDDEYDDDDNAIQEMDDSLTDTSVIDELFNENDSLIEDFNRSNTRIKPEREDDELVSCVLCQKRIKRSEMTAHLERCYIEFLGEDTTVVPFDPDKPSTSKAKPPSRNPKPSTSRKPPTPEPTPAEKREEHRRILLECGYSEEVIANALLQMEKDNGEGASSSSSKREQSAEDQMLAVDEIDLTRVGDECECPVCRRKIPFEEINQHLDGCLGK